MKTRVLLALLLALMVGYSLPAQANTCVASASALAFGSVSPIANTTTSSSGALTITCTWSTITLTPNVLVCASLGTGDGSTSAAPRAMVNGSNVLSYNLFANSSYSTIWGSTTNSSAPTPLSITLSSTAILIGGSSVTTTIPFYGRISAGQTTVPTVNNSTTLYTSNFSGAYTRLDYRFYLLVAPSCASLSASGATFPFTATASVINNCNITATPLTFPSSPLINTSLSATGTISVQCTNSDAYKISLDGGTTNATVANRQMLGAANAGKVRYQLYADSAHSTVWGDGTNSTSQVTGTGSGAVQPLTVYGLVPNQTAPIPDTYTDTVKATIYF